MTPADTSVGSLILWAAAFSTLFSFGTVVWSVFSGPSRKNGAKLDKVSETITDHSMRLRALEQAHNALPTSQNMHELELAMSSLKGEMGVMSQAMSGHAEIMRRLEAIVARHDEHLQRK